jgi:O-antigen/teichoic acid export membrane protein
MFKKNLLANYLGQVWTALMGLAFVPIYVKYLGIESYGIIGMFAIIQASLVLFDMGMIPSLGRELSRFSAGSRSAQSLKDLLRSIEFIGLFIAIVISLIIFLSSRWIAEFWLQGNNLSIELVSRSISIMGIVTALRFIENIYRSALIGLQKQVIFNLINASLATIRSFGAVATLLWISPTLDAFFLWQAVIGIFSVFTFFVITYNLLPRTDRRGKFNGSELVGIWKFGMGVLGINVLAFLLTQVDKVLLSKLLNLNDYGYYTLATSISGSIFYLITPITTSLYPKMCELVSKKDYMNLAENFHKGAQMVTVLVGSCSIVLIFYSKILILLWFNNEVLASRISVFLSIMTFGNLLNCLNWVPYQTQLAFGWTKLAVIVNSFAILFIIPSIIYFVPIWGIEGAAWIWVILNLGYLTISVSFMFKKILLMEKLRWYFQDNIIPLCYTFISVGLFYLFFSGAETKIMQFLILLTSSIIAIITSALSANLIRLDLFIYLKKIKSIHLKRC